MKNEEETNLWKAIKASADPNQYLQCSDNQKKSKTKEWTVNRCIFLMSKKKMKLLLFSTANSKAVGISFQHTQRNRIEFVVWFSVVSFQIKNRNNYTHTYVHTNISKKIMYVHRSVQLEDRLNSTRKRDKCHTITQAQISSWNWHEQKQTKEFENKNKYLYGNVVDYIYYEFYFYSFFLYTTFTR